MDVFPRIYKNIKTISGYIADFLSYILKYIFSGINKSFKFILKDAFPRIYKNIKYIHFKINNLNIDYEKKREISSCPKCI